MDDWITLRVAWRDAALDQLVMVLGKNQHTAAAGRRLARYLVDARALEGHVRNGRPEHAVTRLREWTAERLPELMRARTESNVSR
jgi:hypothetical protein